MTIKEKIEFLMLKAGFLVHLIQAEYATFTFIILGKAVSS